ncbi:hypothetical protein ACOSQ2_021498 [Xanthoceras sorbifolium]
MNAERYAALKEEVNKLLAKGFIRESYYPNWLANLALVKKKNKWKTCANPEKIKALCDMRSPTKPKHVQSLNGHVTALNHFISKSTDKCIPFFNVLWGNKNFEWTEEWELAFQLLKEYIGRGEAYCIPSGNPALYKYGLGAGGEQNPATSLLHEQKAAGHREQISANGEARILPSSGIKKAATLFPSPQH